MGLSVSKHVDVEDAEHVRHVKKCDLGPDGGKQVPGVKPVPRPTSPGPSYGFSHRARGPAGGHVEQRLLPSMFIHVPPALFYRYGTFEGQLHFQSVFLFFISFHCLLCYHPCPTALI